jgi:type III secretion protein D
MDRDPFFFDATLALELRVLAGPQAGARAGLPAGGPLVLAAGGDGEGADIVLRGDAPGARVRITPGPQALLEVINGSATLGDATISAGATVVWAMHVPLKLAGCTVAFGAADKAEWPDPAAATQPEEPAAQQPEPHAHGRRRAARWVVTLGLMVTLGCAGLLGFVHLMAKPRGDVAPPPTLAAALQGSDFASLKVSRDPAGRSVLEGRLQTLSQRTQLDMWLAARGFTPTVEVLVDEAVARDVTNVFRLNGVAVQAKVKGPGHVVAQAAEPNAQRLARAEEVVRRDVRGLTRLEVTNRAEPPPPPPPPVVDDPGKRIASVVPGALAYLVTADGARYFVGAMLPSGHRITAIGSDRVTLERDGQTTTLNL